MGLMQKKSGGPQPSGDVELHGAKGAEVVQNTSVTDDADALDDHKWDCAFAASQDALERLAERARENRKVGRTKRISA